MQKKPTIFIGKTKRTHRERFKEHRQATNNPLHANPQQQSLPTLINLATRWKTWNFFRWNCNHPQHMSRHKVREVYLIDRGKTLSPDGLNRRNGD